MSFHFSQVFPLISERSGWHNGKHSLSSILLPDFFANKSLLYFKNGRSNAAFFISIPHKNPIKRVVFKRLQEVLKLTKVYHSNNQNTLPPLPPNRRFSSHRFWVVTWPIATRVFQQSREAEERESLRTRPLYKSDYLFHAFTNYWMKYAGERKRYK